MNRKVLLIVLALAVVLSASMVHFLPLKVTAMPAIGSNTTTLYPIADSYVNASSPETNYGSQTIAYVSANAEQDFMYLKFDLATIPSGANIIAAKLKLYLTDTGGNIYWSPADKIGAYYCPDNSWTESGITWNNKPSSNPSPTGSYSFGIVYYTGEYKAWNITADVKTAMTSGTLTEVIKFSSKTGNGYALYRSRESTSKPKLDVEYSTQPVYTINLESAQNTGATNNLGLTTFADQKFPLPTAIDVVSGTYQTEYSGGYKFTSWQASGGVTVTNAYASSTTVTVSGNGTLRAVGNAEQLEYTYDHDNAGSAELQTTGRIDAVRFTPLFPGQLLTARFYMRDVSSWSSNTFRVHIMDKDRNDIIAPSNRTPTSEGWFDVDVSSYNVSVNVGTDFYVGMEWITNYNPYLGSDTSGNFDRSWQWNGTAWQQNAYGDFMIRAIVGGTGVIPEFPSTAMLTALIVATSAMALVFRKKQRLK